MRKIFIEGSILFTIWLSYNNCDFNPFQVNVPFTWKWNIEKPWFPDFSCFQEVHKWNIGFKWVNMVILNSVFSRRVGCVPKFSQRMQKYYSSCDEESFIKIANQEWIFLSNCMFAIMNIYYSSKSFIRWKCNKICSIVKLSIC